MTDRILKQFFKIALSLTAISFVFTAAVAGRDTAIGLLAGGAWNLTSLLVLSQLLNAWLGPNRSNRRVVGWLLVKFPLLYLAFFAMYQFKVVSLIGFGIGFTVVLAAAVGTFAVHAMRMNPSMTRE
jgi:hypothetical protein